MATAEEVLNRAFSKAGIKRAGIDLTDDEYATGIDVMNDLLTQWASIGISLGYTRVTVRTDEVTVQNWALKVLKSNLAPLIAGEFERPLTTIMIGEASGDFKLLLQRKVQLDETYLPDTLPVGSGNNPDNLVGNGNFFPDQDFNDILTASGQSMKNEQGKQIDLSPTIEEN